VSATSGFAVKPALLQHGNQSPRWICYRSIGPPSLKVHVPAVSGKSRFAAGRHSPSGTQNCSHACGVGNNWRSPDRFPGGKSAGAVNYRDRKIAGRESAGDARHGMAVLVVGSRRELLRWSHVYRRRGRRDYDPAQGRRGGVDGDGCSRLLGRIRDAGRGDVSRCFSAYREFCRISGTDGDGVPRLKPSQALSSRCLNSREGLSTK